MTYTAKTYIDGFDVQDNLKDTYTFNFTSDGEMPYIVDREGLAFRTGADGRKYLDVTLADNFCLAGATLYSTEWKTNVNNGKKEMSLGSNYYDGIIPALKADGTSPRAYEEYTYTFDVTDFYQKLLNGTFYVVAYDYALNQCAYRVKLADNPVSQITLDQTAVTLPQKGYVQLNATVTPDDATDQNLVWSSSDSSVAEVRGGIVAAKAPGTATITVKSSVWTDVKAQCQITVTDEVGADVPMSEFLLNTSSVTMLPDTTYTNVRLYGYSPFYATDLTLEWTSSDESVVTVEPNGEGDQLTQYAKLTAHKAGTATVTAKAKNGTATYDLAVTINERGYKAAVEVYDEDGVKEFAFHSADSFLMTASVRAPSPFPTASASSGRTPSRTTTTFSTSFAPTAWSRSTTVRSMTATTCRASACLRR